MKHRNQTFRLLARYGADILSAAAVRTQKNYMQHGTTSVYLHCINVAYVSVRLALLFHLRVNYRALIRGALLHDYFLYDWHVPSKTHRGHGFTHAHTALCNAARDFELDAVERDIIEKHMFPLNPAPPRHCESALVCLADKICAASETLRLPMPGAAAAADITPQPERKAEFPKRRKRK